MKKISKKWFILGSVFAIGVAGLSTGLALSNKKEEPVTTVKAEDLFNVKFTGLSLKVHNGDKSNDLRIIIHSNDKTSHPTQQSHPTWWTNEITCFDATIGNYVSLQNGVVGIDGYSGSDYMLSFYNPEAWFNFSSHKLIFEFKKGLVINSHYTLSDNFYLQFVIYVNDEKTGFCFSTITSDTLPSGNPKWIYKPETDNKVEAMLFSFDDFQGTQLSNISIKDNTVGDTEGYLHVNSSEVSYAGTDIASSHIRAQQLPNNNAYDLNFWDKMLFSTDGKQWDKAMYVLDATWGGRLYFNENSTWRWHYRAFNGSTALFSDKYNYIKFEKGAQLPNYFYMSGLDQLNKCYTLDDSFVFVKKDNNWTFKRIYEDPNYGSTPTLFDYGGDFTSFIDEWTTGTETGKSFYNLSNVKNRTFDVAFDWKVMGSGGGDLFRISGTYDGGKYQDTAIYRSSDGKIRVAEVDTTDGGDKWTNVVANVGDVVRIRYKRTYDEDLLGFVSSCWVNGFASDLMDTHCTIKSDHIPENKNNMVMWLRSIKSPGAIKSAVDDDYLTKTFNIELVCEGKSLGTYTVQGGTLMSQVVSCSGYRKVISSLTHYDITGYKNELGFYVNGSIPTTRNCVIEIVGQKQNKVSFDTNGSSSSYQDIYVSNGKTITDLDNYKPEREGYTFDGWTYNGNPVTSSTQITSDMTLVANWLEPLSFSGFGYWNYSTTLSDGEARLTLRFNGHFKGGDTQFPYDNQSDEFSKHVRLNGVSIYDLHNNGNKASIAWYTADNLTDQGFTICINRSYITDLLSNGIPHLFIDEGVEYRGRLVHACSFALIDNNWRVYEFGAIETLESAEVRVFDNQAKSLKFTTRFKASEFGDVRSEALKFGTYIVVEDAYKQSGYSTVGEYIEHTVASGKTYADIPNTGKDFINEATAKTDGFYVFTGTLANIKDSNAFKKFIPVGYVQVGEKIYYGQTGSYSTSLYNELLNVRETLPEAQYALNSFKDVVAINSINGSYGLEVIAGEDNCELTPASDGNYALLASNDISKIVVDGELYSQNVLKDDTIFIQNSINGVKFSDSTSSLLRGFAEPTHEYWQIDTNQASYNTSDNNAALCQLTGAKSMRIWLQIGDFVANDAPNPWLDIGMVSAGYAANTTAEVINSYWHFDETKVNNLKTLVNKYKNSGVEEITFLINNFIHDGDSQIFTLVNNDGTVSRASFWEQNGKTTRGDWPFVNMFPDKYDVGTSNISFNYDKFLKENQQFYKLLGDNFDGLVTSVECMNEINLDPYRFDYRLAENKYVSFIQSNNMVMDDNAYLAEMSMDYCKAMTDGIKQSGADIRVLTPAISPIGDRDDASYQRQAFGGTSYTKVTGFNFKRDGRHYLNECLKYIRDNGNSRFNDYFQGLNIHPYLWDAKDHAGLDNESYLYIKAPKGKVGFEGQTPDVDYNSNYAEDWANDLDRYHNMLEEYGDHNVPFYLTEYGICDKARIDSEHWSLWNSTGFIRTVMRNLDTQICNRSWIKAYYWYRMFDFNNADGSPGETDYGVVDTNGYLKYSGLELYYLNRGSEYEGTDPVVDVGGGD